MTTDKHENTIFTKPNFKLVTYRTTFESISIKFTTSILIISTCNSSKFSNASSNFYFIGKIFSLT